MAMKKSPLTDNSMHMAIHAPLRPIFIDRYAASGILTAHMLMRLAALVKRVLPVPRNTPPITIDAANKGSAKASILSREAPRA